MKTLYRKALLLSVALLATSAFAQSESQPQSLAIGDAVPDFSVRDLKGKTRKLSELRKESASGVVSLTFWCSFCHSCRHMETKLDHLARTLGGKVVVAAVDASAGETAERVSAFAKSKNLSMPILMDSAGQVADLFGVHVTTTTVVIDSQGILRYRGQFVQGQQAFAEEALNAVLGGREVPTAQTSPKG